MSTAVIRKARIADIKQIHSLLMESAGQRLLLPRSLNNLYNHARDFVVIDPCDGTPIVGCCALSITWADIAEIRSLVLKDSWRGGGWGRKLVEECLDDAKSLGIYKVFTLTYQDVFFGKLGFQIVGKDVLPQKVWADCIHCPQFPECNEIAMQLELAR